MNPIPCATSGRLRPRLQALRRRAQRRLVPRYDPAEKDSVSHSTPRTIHQGQECCTCSDCGAELADEKALWSVRGMTRLQRDARAANLVVRGCAHVAQQGGHRRGRWGRGRRHEVARFHVRPIGELLLRELAQRKCDVARSFSQEPVWITDGTCPTWIGSHTKELRRLSDAARGWWRWDNDGVRCSCRSMCGGRHGRRKS